MIITFIGHSLLPNSNDLTKKIKTTIINNIQPNNNTLFFCGGYGDFDRLCAEVCHSIKGSEANCEIIFITPYMTETQQEKMKYMIDSGLYDSTIYPPLENVPPRFAISKRNEWMVNQADLIIAYVKHTYGGAYKSLEFARRKKKHIINLAE